jgi:hypothetical protein
MPNFVIALLFAIGAGTWIYTKVQAKTGGNTQQSLIVAGLLGVLLFLTMLLILAMAGDMISNAF